MRVLMVLPFALGLAAASPLHVSAVVRLGLPPYEDANRLYRLEGEGAGTLRPGAVVTLHRPGRDVRPGRLRVVNLTPQGALAKLESPGDHFPLIGDQALEARPAPFPTFPSLPETTTAAAKISPHPPVARSAAPLAALYFLKGDATVSPGGLAKLRTWAAAWDRTRPWRLMMPRDGEDPGLSLRRAESVRTALQDLGVTQVILDPVPPIEGAPYDVVYLSPGA